MEEIILPTIILPSDCVRCEWLAIPKSPRLEFRDFGVRIRESSHPSKAVTIKIRCSLKGYRNIARG